VTGAGYPLKGLWKIKGFEEGKEIASRRNAMRRKNEGGQKGGELEKRNRKKGWGEASFKDAGRFRVSREW